MAVLLIVIFAVSLGNIYGQQDTFRPLNSQSTVRLAVSRPDYREKQYPPPWLRYPVHTISYVGSGVSDSFDLSAQKVRELEPRRRVATRNRNTSRMEGKQTVRNSSGQTPKNIAVQNCSEVYDHVDFENTSNSPFYHQQNVNKTTGDFENTNNSSFNHQQNVNKTTDSSDATDKLKPQRPEMPRPNTTDVALKPEVGEVTEKPNVTDVIIDLRDSFNGDKCATGYVRINNDCVKVD